MQTEKRKNKNKLIPILCLILAILLVACVGIFIAKNDGNSKKLVDNKKEQSVEEKVDGEEINEKEEQNAEKAQEVAFYEIDTDYCKLYFPERWKEQIEVKYTEEAGYKAEFYGLVEGKDAQHLFDVCFNSDDGFLLGSLVNDDDIVNISIELCELEFDDTWKQEEIDQIYAMQEEMNFVMESLSKNENYVQP